MKNPLPKFFKFYALLSTTILLSLGCNSENPKIITIHETVIVEIPSTVIVTQPVEIVEMDVTRVVEVMVTRIATPTSISTEEATPTPSFFEPYPFGTYTEIPEVDAAARAVLTRNIAALRELIHFESWACVHENDPYGPICNEEEPIGTEVEAFSYAYCEGFGTRAEEVIMSVLEELVARATGVYAVYLDETRGSYGLIFTTTDIYNAITVLINDNGISWVLLGCNQSPTELLTRGNGNVILPPITR